MAARPFPTYFQNYSTNIRIFPQQSSRSQVQNEPCLLANRAFPPTSGTIQEQHNLSTAEHTPITSCKDACEDIYVGMTEAWAQYPYKSRFSLSLSSSFPIMALLGLRDFLFLCFCGALHFLYRYRRKPLVPLPPTIPGWPIVGNAFQIPLTNAHVFYKELGQRLG